MDKVETYLGAGLYVEFDGFGFTLRAPRAEGDHWVYLEPLVLQRFEDFIKQCRNAQHGAQ